MKNTLYLFLIAFGFVGFTACADWAEGIDDPIDQLTDDNLNDESVIPFVVTGVQARFTQTHDRLTCEAGGLADELIFDDAVPNATFPTYREIDTGDILLDNNTVDGTYSNLNEARYYADNLLERVDGIGTFDDPAIEASARFWGNFVGGVTRFWLGAYFGPTETVGGAPIDKSAVIPSATLYADAVTKLTEALNHADAYQAKMVNTTIAHIHLISGDYAAAAASAANGLVSGDAPFQGLHNNESSNYWRGAAGNSRAQFVVDDWYVQLLLNEPEEAARIVIEQQATAGGHTYYRQALYPENGSPINFVTWQLNELILAECALRGQAGAGDALTRVNAVRASHGISALSSIDLAGLMVERRKELFTLGYRALDQRRAPESGGWHIAQGSPYSVPSTTIDVLWTPWQYFPITSQERNQNPNVD